MQKEESELQIKCLLMVRGLCLYKLVTALLISLDLSQLAAPDPVSQERNRTVSNFTTDYLCQDESPKVLHRVRYC